MVILGIFIQTFIFNTAGFKKWVDVFVSGPFLKPSGYTNQHHTDVKTIGEGGTWVERVGEVDETEGEVEQVGVEDDEQEKEKCVLGIVFVMQISDFL